MILLRWVGRILPCFPLVFLAGPSCVKKAQTSAPAGETSTTYWEKCRQVLGPMPKLNCEDGVEIPVEKPKALGFGTEAVTAKTFDLDKQKCDAPKWAPGDTENEACLPHASIARYPSQDATKDTDWVLLCRPMRLFPQGSFLFGSIQLIGHNPSTGETCFFEGPLNAQTLEKGNDGRKIPEIATPEGEKFWQDPQRVYRYGCVGCHSPYPWIRSPAVRHLQKNGIPIVPSNVPWGPYKVVQHGDLFVSADEHAISVREVVMPKSGNLCLTCHRLPADHLYHSNGIIPLHLGDVSLVRHINITTKIVNRMTDRALRFPSSPIHWEKTPPSFPKPLSRKEWDEAKARQDFLAYAACVRKNEARQHDGSCFVREVTGGELSGLNP